MGEVRTGYRYFGTGKSKFDNINAAYGARNFEIGVLFWLCTAATARTLRLLPDSSQR